MLGLQQSLSELMRKNCKDNDFATLYRSDFRYFPKGFFPKCILPSGDFPNVKFPKRQLPESVLAAALSPPPTVVVESLGPLFHPSRSARPPIVA